MNNGNNRKNENNRDEDIFLIDLQLISTFIFIVATIVSLILTYDEKLNLTNRKRMFTTKQTLEIAFYNRIVILIVVLLTLYVGYKNYIDQEDNTVAKFKSGLLCGTNILTLISAIIILYVAYLNRNDINLTPSDVENPLV